MVKEDLRALGQPRKGQDRAVFAQASGSAGTSGCEWAVGKVVQGQQRQSQCLLASHEGQPGSG